MVDAYFLDSSALLKRYVPEIGTAWIQSIADPQNQNLLIVAHIAWVEISSAVARRQREGNISNIEANQVLAAFRSHWNTQYFIAFENQCRGTLAMNDRPSLRHDQNRMLPDPSLLHCRYQNKMRSGSLRYCKIISLGRGK